MGFGKGEEMKKKSKKPRKNETINEYVARTGEPFPITKKQLKEFERMIKDRSYDIKIPSRE